MNTETGAIIPFEVYNELDEIFKEDYEVVENKDMTKKQMNQKRVSLHDHKSKLGRKLTNARQQKRFNRTR